MSNIVKVETADYGGKWNEKDIAFFREKFAKNSTPEEFKHFLDICARYDLDPRVGHIYLQKYEDRKNGGWSPAAIIIGYHGLLHVANRDGLLDGIESTCLLDGKNNATGAIAVVWKKGCTHPFRAEVDFAEYKGNSPFWNNKPKTMIKKVAEAHALRKAFNLAGLYLKEELEQQDVEVLPVLHSELAKSIPAPAIKELPRENNPKMSQETFLAWLKRMETAPAQVAGMVHNGAKSVREILGKEPHLTRIKENFPGDELRYVLWEYVFQLQQREPEKCGWVWDKDADEPIPVETPAETEAQTEPELVPAF